MHVRSRLASRFAPAFPGVARPSCVPLAMAFCLCGTVLLVQAQATAPTTSTPAAPAPAVTAPAAVAVLTMLQQRDETLKDFTARIRYEVYHPRTEDTVVQKGDASYVKTADGVKFAAHFTHEGAAGQFQAVDHTLIFDGRWIIDCDAKNKVFQKTQIVPPGAQIRPLKLGEGPLPIPIGQDTQKVLRDFAVTLAPTDPKLPDAAAITHLKLVPQNPQLCKTYDMASLEIWVNKTLELPVKLLREGLDENTTTITLDDIKINEGAAKVFDLPTPKTGEGWDVRIDTLEKKKAAE